MSITITREDINGFMNALYESPTDNGLTLILSWLEFLVEDGFPLTTGGNDRGETGGNDRRGGVGGVRDPGR